MASTDELGANRALIMEPKRKIMLDAPGTRNCTCRLGWDMAAACALQ